MSREAVIELAATDIFEKIPEPFDIDVVTHKYPTTYGQSMNTVLTQECIRYSALLEVILDTLKEALKALKGLVVMSPELEQVTDAIFDNRVPEMWTSKAYPSLKPLSSWVIDLLERLTFIDQWIENGPPAVYWISGLFFPQARIFAFPKSEHCLPPLFQRTTRVVCSVASTRGVCSVASTSNTYWHTRGCYKYSRNALFADCPPVHHGLPTVCQSPSTIHPYQDSATDLFRFTIAGISHRDVTKLRAQKRVRHRPSHMELQRGGWKDRGQHP